MRRIWMIPVGALLAGSAGAAPTAWVVNFNTTIDVVNVANNLDNPYGSSVFQSDSLARSASGNLYIATGPGVIFDVTGAPVPLGPTGKTQIGDLDWDSNGLWGFSNATGELFFFDLGSNTVTSSTPISGLGGATITGVAHHLGTGDIYLSGNMGLNTDVLYRVPFAQSAAVTIGSMGIGDALSYISDIDFDASGTLYAMTWFHRWFYTVDINTAATTFVSSGPHRDATGLALHPVPEPGILLALGVGALGLRRHTRRPRQPE